MSTGACGDGDSSTSNSIAVANAVPTDVEGSATNLEEACNVDMGQRILSFSAAPPAPAPGATDLRTRYAATRPKTAVSSLVSGGRRKIPSTADKVLDAPGMFEDYYLNLLDWGEMNTLAVALQSAVYIWNASSGEVFQLCDLEGDPTKVGGGPEAYVSSLRWSQDGQHLAVGGDRGHIQLWDVGAQTRVRTVNKGADTVKPRVSVLAWDKDGTLNSGSANGVIAEYDLRGENPETRTLEGHAGEVCGLEWRADAALLASGGNDNVVNVWDRRTTVPKMTKTNHHAAVKVCAHTCARFWSCSFSRPSMLIVGIWWLPCFLR